MPKRVGYELSIFLQTFTRYVLLMDAMERPIPRSSVHERQQYEYSGHRGNGKKKCHTVKNNLIVDQKSSILFVSSTYAGSVHDKTLADEVGHQFSDHTILVEDLGYLGYEPENMSILQSKKKPKNGGLTQQEKEENKCISQKCLTINQNDL